MPPVKTLMSASIKRKQKTNTGNKINSDASSLRREV